MSGFFRPELLSTETPEQFDRAVAAAVRRLERGEVVALPTETVYGLAANALDPAAVERIYAAKGRPAHNPIIVHVAGLEMARRCAAEWPELATRLAGAFWPGPLTLVLPRGPAIPGVVTAGGGTVGLRWPAHPFMQAVIRACGFPLAAPSANPANHLSPTSAEHVLDALAGRIPLVIDGGHCQVGIESTVLDLTVTPPAVLRPGMIAAPALQAVLDGQLAAEPGAGGPLRSPGLLRKHYSPRARLILRQWTSARNLEAEILAAGGRPAQSCVVAHTRIPAAGRFARVAVIPRDAEAYARALYGELHACDATGAGLIVVERVPGGPEWSAIADRLRRAAAE